MNFIHSKKKTNIMFTTSFRFITNLNKDYICEYINIIMNETGAQTFGYQRMNDEYWGKIKINNVKNIEFTLSFQTTKHTKSTVIVVSVMSFKIIDSDKLCSKIHDTIKILETTPSIYKKKYSC